jgi:hypothetical protein
MRGDDRYRDRGADEMTSRGESDRKGTEPSYEIRVVGQLDALWGEWFDDLTLTHGGDGTTALVGPVADQAALHGLLAKVRDLGLPLLSVNRVQGDG